MVKFLIEKEIVTLIQVEVRDPENMTPGEMQVIDNSLVNLANTSEKVDEYIEKLKGLGYEVTACETLDKDESLAFIEFLPERYDEG